MSNTDSSRLSKRPLNDDLPFKETPGLQTNRKDTEMKDAEGQNFERVPRSFTRMALTINPDYVASLVREGSIGFARTIQNRNPTIVYYEIEVDNLRGTISALLTSYLKKKLYESNSMTFTQADTETASIVPVITNACMAALYAKLKTINDQFQTYSTQFNTRFSTRPTYTKEIELPLPLADAISNIGVFTPDNYEKNIVCVPVYPENVQTENWSSYEYESCLPYFKECGIPVKSVDTGNIVGTAWWTFRVSLVYNCFDFRCIYPPSNYSDHGCLTAIMFARLNDEQEVLPIIKHKDTDEEFAYRIKEIPAGCHLKAFAAICQAPSEEWTQYLPISK